MAITRLSLSSILNSPKYDSILANQQSLPSVPTIGTATDLVTGTSVSVAFTPGGIKGNTYTVLSTPGSITATGTSSPITVTGLTAGTAYTFQVRATNNVGNSPYSAASNSVTPTVPSYALAATITSTQNWTVPAGITQIAVWVIGAGGGGGSAAGGNWGNTRLGFFSSGGAGAGPAQSGMIASAKDISVSAGDVYAVNIGSGGNGAAANNTGGNGTFGNAGGTTAFGNLFTLTGGGGGNAGSGQNTRGFNTINVTANSNVTTNLQYGGGYNGTLYGGYGEIYAPGSQPSTAGSSDNSVATLSQNLTGLGSVSYSVSFVGGSGGGGPARAGGANNVGAGSGGASGNRGAGGSIGGTGNGYGGGAGGGGGGGNQVSGAGVSNGGAGGTGRQGVVYIYTK
jgi:hypothetical protein